MKRLIFLLTLAAAPVLAKDDCKSTCAGVRAQCASACDSATKNKKNKTACVQQGCEQAVAACESSCRGGNGKHK